MKSSDESTGYGNWPSVTRCVEYFSKFGHLQQCEFDQRHTKFTKEGSKFCVILNVPSKLCQRLVRFCQSGEISPNLVSLALALSCSFQSSHLNLKNVSIVINKNARFFFLTVTRKKFFYSFNPSSMDDDEADTLLLCRSTVPFDFNLTLDESV